MNMQGAAGVNSAARVGAPGLNAGAITRNSYTFHFKAAPGEWITLTAPDGSQRRVKEHFETIENLTTTEGRTEMLDKFFKGSSYTAAWYAGLMSNTSIGTPAVGDTAAKITTSTPSSPTTNDWAESTGYSESTRQAIVFGSAASASIDSSASPAVFTINTSVSLYGGFIITNSTKGGTTGKIYGLGAFASVIGLSAGTVSVYFTLTIASA